MSRLVCVHGVTTYFDFPILRGVVGIGPPEIEFVTASGIGRPMPTRDEWAIYDSGHLDVAHLPGATLLSSYCGSRAWFDPKSPGVIRVFVSRAPSISSKRFTHTVLHAFLPNIFSSLGKVMIHAAAVIVDGKAVLLSGPSGSGKSTLAAGYLQRGDVVLSDDVIRLSSTDAGCVAYPSYAGARLRTGSFLLPKDLRSHKPSRFGLPKHRVGEDVVVDGIQYPVGAMFFLGRNRSVRPKIERISGAELLTDWLEASFLQALPKERFAREGFLKIGGIANRIPSYRLSYKRSARHFDQLLDDIVEFARSLPE